MSKKKKKKIRQPQYKPKQARTMKEWWRDQTPLTQKRIRIAAIAVCAVIVLALVYYYAIYDDGSLRIRRDAVVGKQDSWLIAELEEGKNSSFYKLADVATPDGYTASEDSAFGYTITSSRSTDHKTNFTFESNDAENPIWVHIRISYGGRTLEGYSSQRYVAIDGIRHLSAGDTFTVTANTNDTGLQWTCSDSTVATIDAQTGTLTAIRKGLVLIRVTSDSGLEDSCLIMID